jgi:hypothetical protein
MNKKVKGVRGQTELSFGMIFSVILIIVFIAFAVYGIIKFFEVKNLGQIEKFKGDFQIDIDNMWKSTQGSQPVSYLIPKKIKQVCFVDDKFENMYFVPADYKGVILKNIDITKTIAGSTSKPKELCIATVDGKISMTITKAYNENLVTITK